MYKILNILLLSLSLIFFFSTYRHYSSNKNIKIKEFNRTNIDQIINKKISNLPVLFNDKNNIIEFNNSILNENIIDKPRSFWNLLKYK